MDWNTLFAPVATWWQISTDRWTGRHPADSTRSSEWPKVRDAHLAAHPNCACCGGTDTLRVHHVIPFHIQPELELQADNLITLCEAKKYGINCHLLVGHLGNWRRWNPMARFDAKRWAIKFSGKLPGYALNLQTWLSKKAEQ